MKIEDISMYIEAESSVFAGELDIETLKAQAACSYYLQLSSQKKFSGRKIVPSLFLQYHDDCNNYENGSKLHGSAQLLFRQKASVYERFFVIPLSSFPNLGSLG